MKGEVIIKNLQLFLFVMVLLLVSGCSNDFSANRDEIEYFSTKEEALTHYIDKELINGNIDLVTTTQNDLLLVTQSSQNTYFVGELKEEDEGISAVRLSDSVQMELGAAWELVTQDGNEYTIYFEKTNEMPDMFKFSNDEYFVSVVDGHAWSDDLLIVTNAVKEVDILKSN